MLRVLFGAFLVVHGLIHLSWLTPKPQDPNYPFAWKSPWLPNVAPDQLQGIGTALIALLVLAFFVAALGVWGVPGLGSVWGAAAVLGSVLSLIVTLVLWHPWFVAGPVLDLAIIATVFFGWIK